MSPRKPDRLKRLGLMGGSFDPIHFGHLAAAEEAVSKFNLDQVIFIPCGHPPHKDAARMTGAEDRYLMTGLAIASDPRFALSRYEIDKTEPSYTADTMRHFAEMYPGVGLFFITGADSVLELDTWHEPEKIYEYGHLIGATRPGYTVERAPKVADRVIWMEIPALGISATEIRRRIKEGLPVTYLMPAAVLDYIQSRRLYRE